MRSSRRGDSNRMCRAGGRAANIRGGVVSQMPMQTSYVGGESGHGRCHPDFTLADVTRRKLTDTGCLNKLTFILVTGLPYELSFADIEAMTGIRPYVVNQGTVIGFLGDVGFMLNFAIL